MQSPYRQRLLILLGGLCFWSKGMSFPAQEPAILGAAVVLNDPPVAVNDTVSVVSGDTILIDVLTNDSDPDGDPLDVFLLLPPVHGSAETPGLTAIRYIPNPDYVGPDSIIYRVCDSGVPILCADARIAIQVLADNLPPVVRADTIRTVQNLPVRYNLLSNDSDPENQGFSSVRLIEAPVFGNAGITSNGQLNYVPATDFAGMDSFRYEACDGADLPLCDKARIYLQVDPLDIPDSFSPNGDGIHDFWVIEGVLAYPDNSLEIVDRRGAVVLEQTGYTNTWDGRDQNTQRDLPEDVYFYRFRLPAYGAVLSGSITLRR